MLHPTADDSSAPGTTRYLLTRHHQGDPSALGELLERELSFIRDRVHHQLGGALRRRMDTNDVVQEICLRVLRRGPRFLVRDPRCFRALMARIVYTQLVSSFRQNGASLQHERNHATDTWLDLDGSGATTGVADEAAREEEKEMVRLALLLLEPLDAEVLRLRDEESLSFVAIADRLGQKDDAVRMRYRRAIRKLEHCVVQLRRGRVDALLADLERESTSASDLPDGSAEANRVG
jgi:RNA polymerase sigma factor (sigma-70 family)